MNCQVSGRLRALVPASLLGLARQAEKDRKAIRGCRRHCQSEVRRRSPPTWQEVHRRHHHSAQKMSSKSLRSLMKDRQLAKRIQHQFAKYDSLGRLTCTICLGVVVKSEALWPSHLTSKPHRLNLQRHQSNTNNHLETNPQASSLSKRKPDDPLEHHTDADSPQGKKVRFKAPSPTDGNPETPPSETVQSGLPSDFFDDPSQAPDLSKKEDPSAEEDPEWEAFQAVLNTSSDDTSANLFAQASQIAEPVFYPLNPDSEETSPHNIEIANEIEHGKEEEEVEEDPIEKKIKEEKEEIMYRIQNEEREQLEADERVLRMKARINAFRASRKKAAKAN
ncbi:hypothetical protein O181_064526 [Austropuccinia psidii MF-1]|uniref:Coiled-coil domain-containing protein 16 n=1 Tax=Austropuccinia psidii MF-1 TaxID=1389203 RepID=A0A9Q3ETU9_9BASI|nr:hypothetical protein [Austropuccinia psidii MF-1]